MPGITWIFLFLLTMITADLQAIDTRYEVAAFVEVLKALRSTFKVSADKPRTNQLETRYSTISGAGRCAVGIASL